MFLYLKLRSMSHNPEPQNSESSSHPQLSAIRDSLLELHNRTSVEGFLIDPKGRIELLDEFIAICSEQRAILEAMTIA